MISYLKVLQHWSKVSMIYIHTKLRSSQPEVFLTLSWRRPLYDNGLRYERVNKRCSENMQQIYRSTCHGFSCSPVNLLRIFRTPFSKNITGWLLLKNLRQSWMVCLKINLSPMSFRTQTFISVWKIIIRIGFVWFLFRKFFQLPVLLDLAVLWLINRDFVTICVLDHFVRTLSELV